MPQLDIFSFESTIISVVLVYFILLFVLDTISLPKIATVLKLRNKLVVKSKDSQTITFKPKNADITWINTLLEELKKAK